MTTKTPQKKIEQNYKQNYRLRSFARRCLPEKSSLCQCGIRVNADRVEVIKSDEGTYHLGGIRDCGSVWNCPVCSSRISQTRRREVQACVDKNAAAGGSSFLLTLTVPHFNGFPLDSKVKMFNFAYRNFKSYAGWNYIQSEGLIGSISASETTHSFDNGWHYHKHIILLFDRPQAMIRMAKVRRLLCDSWQKATIKQGFARPSNKHGLDLIAANDVSSYVTKMGLAMEVTRGNFKKARSTKSRTPFQILSDFGDFGDEVDMALFREYADAMFRKNALVFSRGLKDLFLVDEITDDEIIAVIPDEVKTGKTIGYLSVDNFYRLRKVIYYSTAGMHCDMKYHPDRFEQQLLAANILDPP